MSGFGWVVSVLSCVGVAAVAMDVTDFFPDVKGDLTKVTWAHAVNSQKLLNDALDRGVMMLEADVSLGKLKDAGEVPIMAHPPDNTSDLSLEQLLDRLIKENKAGLKLDFKSKEVFNKSVSLLADRNEKIKFPLWLNADILAGPVNSTTTPVDANLFLQQARDRFPNRTLSVGWTTRFGGNVTEGSYQQEHIKAMRDLLEQNNISQPVTFPVRAALAVRSQEVLLGLMTAKSNATLTLWGPDTDPLDHNALDKFVSTVGKQRVYLDLPNSTNADHGGSSKVRGMPFVWGTVLAALGLALIARINHI
ncbi:protein FAM151B [Anabrus simplex]|uniref:protein FAM151B n=1 Tax=Anabrus simplex TaxID=316456 RepID=UPI0035A3CE47